MQDRRRLLSAVLVVLTAAGCGSSHEPPPRHVVLDGGRPVLATGADEEAAVAGAGAIAWMTSPRFYRVPPRAPTSVRVRVGGRTVRVNPPGTFAQTGGIDGRGLYVQVVAGGRSRLARFDLDTRHLVYLPAWVNDGAWLWHPSADAGRLLYGAIEPGRATELRYEVRLADLRRHTVHVLAALDGHNEYAAPGQLRGSWATWVACPENTCDVWRASLRSGAATQAPDADRLVYTQIAPAVAPDGTVWFERALASCGDASILRWRVGGATRRVARLPPHTAYQYGFASSDGRTLLLDPGPCDARADTDVVALRIR